MYTLYMVDIRLNLQFIREDGVYAPLHSNGEVINDELKNIRLHRVIISFLQMEIFFIDYCFLIFDRFSSFTTSAQKIYILILFEILKCFNLSIEWNGLDNAREHLGSLRGGARVAHKCCQCLRIVKS